MEFPPSPESTLTFAGVEFSKWEWLSSSGDRPVPDWNNLITRTDALKIAGSLLWDLRVRQERLREYPQFRSLYREVGSHVTKEEEVLIPFEKEKTDSTVGTIWTTR